MAANPKAGARANTNSISSSSPDMGTSGRKGDWDNLRESSEDISFVLFERQWRRYLANFQRRRLLYMGFYKESLCGLDLSSGVPQAVQDMEFRDAVDATTYALYNSMDEESNCNGPNPTSLGLSSTPR